MVSADRLHMFLDWLNLRTSCYQVLTFVYKSWFLLNFYPA